MSASRPKIAGYAIGKRIGHGAFADVYLAVNQKNGQRCACKCIPRSALSSASATKITRQETMALKTLNHPNIVTFLSINETESWFTFLMELCEGGSLESEIVKNRSLDESSAKKIFEQIISALEYCHARGIAHRDLKPSNILITKFPQVKISDFGLSGVMGVANQMSTQCGTFFFVAPECSAGCYDGAAADIFSAGVVLYTMLSGRVPWRESAQVKLLEEIKRGPDPLPTVSSECNDLIRAMLSANPLARPRASEIRKHAWFVGAPVVKPEPVEAPRLAPVRKKPSIRLSFDA